MTAVTIGKKRIARPVRVRSHAGIFVGPGPDGEEVTVPGYDGILMDRNLASRFLSIPHSRYDSKGEPTPKALTFECEACATPYPPKHHDCFGRNLEEMGILPDSIPCNLCGDQIDEKGGMVQHFELKHKGIHPKGFVDDKASKVATDSGKVAELEDQVRTLTNLVTKLMTGEKPTVLPTKARIGEIPSLQKLGEELLGK